jgi:hypothetical protein
MKCLPNRIFADVIRFIFRNCCAYYMNLNRIMSEVLHMG